MLIKSLDLDKRHIFFFIAGILAVLTDYLFYVFIIELAGQNLAKIIGFYAGVIVSFLINGRVTFNQTNQNFLTSIYFLKYLLALTVSMFINVTANHFVLNLFSFLPVNFMLAFFVATFLSMCFNFFIMKYWIFK
tara:strand:+ start:17363 stop:17764 length:402 start_codon:yes stop_codon:yes gene_type:complete